MATKEADRIRGPILGATLAVALITPAQASPPARAALPDTPKPVASTGMCRATFNIRDFRAYTSKVYRRDRVSKPARRRMARMQRCSVTEWRRRRMARWQRRYQRERQARKAAARARARAAAATPYGQWAIPAPIVMCESGGTNHPPNSAGASGYYQIIPGTWKAFGGRGPAAYLAPKSEQDRVARLILADGIHHWNPSRHCWGGRV